MTPSKILSIYGVILILIRIIFIPNLIRGDRTYAQRVIEDYFNFSDGWYIEFIIRNMPLYIGLIFLISSFIIFLLRKIEITSSDESIKIRETTKRVYQILKSQDLSITDICERIDESQIVVQTIINDLLSSGKLSRTDLGEPSAPYRYRIRKVSWSFWLWWILANLVGGLLALVIYVAVSLPMDPRARDLTALIVSRATGGAIVGTTQWLVLRQQVFHAGRWILASLVYYLAHEIINYAAANNAVGKLENMSSTAFWVFAASLTTEVVCGTMQWFVLRRQVFQAWWWVLAIFVSSFVSMYISTTVGFAVRGAISGFVTGTVGLVVREAIRGATLVWLLRRPMPAQGLSQVAQLRSQEKSVRRG